MNAGAWLQLGVLMVTFTIAVFGAAWRLGKTLSSNQKETQDTIGTLRSHIDAKVSGLELKMTQTMGDFGTKLASFEGKLMGLEKGMEKGMEAQTNEIKSLEHQTRDLERELSKVQGFLMHGGGQPTHTSPAQWGEDRKG